MKSYIFLLCFTGVVPLILSVLQPVTHRYYVIKTKVTWPDAQKYCRETYTDLATIESELDWTSINALIAKSGLTSYSWIGLYNDINSWRWSLNDAPLTTQSYWYSSQPDNLHGDQSCAIIGTSGNLYDYECTLFFNFICFNATNSYSNRFVGVKSLSNWSEAQAYCRKFHTDLATVNSSADYYALLNIANKQSSSWIGLYRDTWKWSDGTNTSNLMWGPGLPDNLGITDNCAVLYKGMFLDETCTRLYPFICHYTAPVRKRQIMKVQVKSTGNVFDSDVQTAILELIRQNLEDNGMVNTTVTWRVQSDGQIFYKNKTEP